MDQPNGTNTNVSMKESRTVRWFKWGAFAVFFVALSIGSYALYESLFGGSVISKYSYTEDSFEGSPFCNVLGLNIHGTILTYVPAESYSADMDVEAVLVEDVLGSEDIVAYLEEAQVSNNIKAILVEIDSPGGSPVGAEEIVSALKASKKPTVAIIRQTGTSAAYWIATGADRIYASRNSDVGGIGVSMSYLRNLNSDKQYVELASGEFKDTGDPDKGITSEERKILMRDVDIVHQNFVEAVAINRNIDIDKVRQFADGSSMLGLQAKEAMLIDDIGSWQEAKEYLKERIGEDVEVCWKS